MNFVPNIKPRILCVIAFFAIISFLYQLCSLNDDGDYDTITTNDFVEFSELIKVELSPPVFNEIDFYREKKFKVSKTDKIYQNYFGNLCCAVTQVGCPNVTIEGIGSQIRKYGRALTLAKYLNCTLVKGNELFPTHGNISLLFNLVERDEFIERGNVNVIDVPVAKFRSKEIFYKMCNSETRLIPNSDDGLIKYIMERVDKSKCNLIQMNVSSIDGKDVKCAPNPQKIKYNGDYYYSIIREMHKSSIAQSQRTVVPRMNYNDFNICIHYRWGDTCNSEGNLDKPNKRGVPWSNVNRSVKDLLTLPCLKNKKMQVVFFSETCAFLVWEYNYFDHWIDRSNEIGQHENDFDQVLRDFPDVQMRLSTPLTPQFSPLTHPPHVDTTIKDLDDIDRCNILYLGKGTFGAILIALAPGSLKLISEDTLRTAPGNHDCMTEKKRFDVIYMKDSSSEEKVCPILRQDRVMMIF